MTHTKKRKKSNRTRSQVSRKRGRSSLNHLMRVYIMYFVIFGTILAFIGLMGEGNLTGGGWFMWILVMLNVVISIIATATHVFGTKSKRVDKLAEKW